MIFIICVTQAVLCSIASPDCTNIIKHGQMKGLLLATTKDSYLGDFSDSAEFKNFKGDFTSVTINKSKCTKFEPEIK